MTRCAKQSTTKATTNASIKFFIIFLQIGDLEHQADSIGGRAQQSQHLADLMNEFTIEYRKTARGVEDDSTPEERALLKAKTLELAERLMSRQEPTLVRAFDDMYSFSVVRLTC